jgi:U4/U6 small nuclear ribonucleoprotein PRP4
MKSILKFNSEKPIGDLEGHHPHRVSRAEFHPSGRFVATCW